jgi:hypothetical protein
MNSIKKHTRKFVVIPDGNYHGVYELTRTLKQVAPPEHGEVKKCQCCAGPMKPALDVIQQGFWDDSFNTYFVCLPCKKAELFTYTLSRIEPKFEKKVRKAK